MITINMVDMTAYQTDLEKSDNISFIDLPTYVLLEIFQFCSVKDLLNLSRTCWRFNNLIKSDFVWIRRSKSAPITNQLSEEVKRRSHNVLPCIERCRISHNWQSGRYKENVFCKTKDNYMPWLFLEKDILWLSRGCYIIGVARQQGVVRNASARRPHRTLAAHMEDVTRFVVRDNLLVSAGRDGRLCGWNTRTGKLNFVNVDSHLDDITDVDYDGGELIVSVSCDLCLKVWSLTEDGSLVLEHTQTCWERICSVRLEPGGRRCAFGTSGYSPKEVSLQLYDVQSHQIITDFEVGNQRIGAGTLGIHWEAKNTLLSCGYDGELRIWDTRSRQCVQSWADPYDSALYCVTSDNIYNIICGTAEHGRVILWDKRWPSPVQMYFPAINHSSPVYSVAFDPQRLFIALDKSISIFDFSGYSNISRNYR